MKDHSLSTQALLVVGANQLTAAEELIAEHLRNLGCEVVAKNSIEADVSRLNQQCISLVVISPDANADEIKHRFREVTIPVVVMAGALYEEMRMTGATDFYEYGQKSGVLVRILSPGHPLAADLKDAVRLSHEAAMIPVGVLGGGARRIAVVEEAGKAALFAYDEGDPMMGLNAPARRVGIFFDDFAMREPSSPYWKLLHAAFAWALGERPSQFADAFRAEWAEIQTRRERHYVTEEAAERYEPPTAPPPDLVGLSLSGGGIRAATFALGLLQGMHRLGLTRVLDYVSTVSGGGYLGGWWSAWLRRNPDEQRGGHDIFPPAERIMGASDRLYEGQAQKDRGARLSVNKEVAEDLLSAGNDPIHHLRLFANYLTPRKGALSHDTWRAAAVITRDLILTWIILLPLLIAAILVGKIYFAVQPQAWDVNSQNAFFLYSALAPPRVLLARGLLVAWPLLGLLGWVVVMTCAWMLTGSSTSETRREWWAGKLGAVTVAVLGVLLALGLLENFRRAAAGSNIVVHARWFVVWGLVAALLFVYVLLWPRSDSSSHEDPSAQKRWQREVRRNLIIRIHASLLVTTALVAFILLLAGYGHEAVNYLLAPTQGQSKVLSYVAKSGGWLAVIAALGGSIFTAIKTSPAGGSDPRETKEPTLMSRLIFRFTPSLIIIVLAVTASWLANMLLSYATGIYLSDFIYQQFNAVEESGLSQLAQTDQSTNLIQLLNLATCLGIVLSFYFALVETNWRYNWINQALLVLWGVLATLTVVTLALACWTIISQRPYVPQATSLAAFTDWSWTLDWMKVRALLLVCYAGGILLAFRLAGDERRRVRSIFSPAFWVIVGIVLMEWLIYKYRSVYVTENAIETVTMPAWTILFVSGGLLFSFLFALGESFAGRRDNRRSLSLMTGVHVMTTALFLLSLAADYSDVKFNKAQDALAAVEQSEIQEQSQVALQDSARFTEQLSRDIADAPQLQSAVEDYARVINQQALFGLIGALLTWVIAMGWMADPNSLSMHTFYKARLVRAYLGASNKHRSEQCKGITEAVEGDDVLLKDLQNCNRGAPYHLVNTTLNLVGGRDLTTAQRSAATFVLSKRYCGSARTGFRDTREYMGGQLSLGTAVATSGAAASPNMGAKTLTASLAMLMTFLNVRLGHWSPTPNKEDWRASKARLWPFYVLREFLSQTNDLASYCYLTDGGHFDNTGLYSLVERGCRFIIATDCGADPRPCFQDIGDALRRCRIDFNAHFELNISPLSRTKGGAAEQHFIVGSVLYAREHVRALGWYSDLADEEREALIADDEARRGTIIIFKPTLTNKYETADVRQYGLENPHFPQQKTADQWYDEAQFESYRQLGQLCAELAFSDLDEVEKVFQPAARQSTGFHLSNVRELFRQARDKFDPKFAAAPENNGHTAKSAAAQELQKLL